MIFAVRTKWLSLILLPMVSILTITRGVNALDDESSSDPRDKSYVGFDRNDYPGDASVPLLKNTFAFTGYWLNVPPGGKNNSWTGKRALLREAGLGFLVLFNGRLDAELKKTRNAADLGKADAAAAATAAKREGFPPNTIIFLDQEEGGRMLPEQKAYIYAWVDGVNAGGFRAGVYCSGIPAPEGSGSSVVTAEDIRQSARERKIVYWVTNDACPPSPGCVVPKKSLLPRESGVHFAEVWQYAQSPKRKDVAAVCPKNYAIDGNCYAPGLDREGIFIDLNVARTSDPSAGR
jgi:glycoside hydrolase-like protein